MFCSNCGNRIKDGSNFCGECGNRVEPIVSNNITTKEIDNRIEFENILPNSDNKLRKKKRKKWVVPGVSIILVVIVIAVLVLALGKNTYISTLSDISGGIAQATIKTGLGTYYEAIIDTNGNAKYVCDASEQIIYAPATLEDVGCVGSKDGKILKLINGEGEVIKICDGSEFDKFLAFGGGYALAYKHQTTIDSETHLYGIINNKGEWAVKLTDYGQEPFKENKLHSANNGKIQSDYAGANVFDIRIDSSGEEHMLINAKTGKAFWVYFGWSGYKDYDKDISFEDGVHYGVCNSSGRYYHAYVSDVPLRMNGKTNGDAIAQKDYYRTTHDFKLYPDGTWKTLVKQSEDVYNNVTLDYPPMNGYKKSGDKWLKRTDDYIAIYDQSKKTITPFTKYKSSMVRIVNFEGDYSVALIDGADQKSYFTVINSTGEIQFEPIRYSEPTPTYSSGKVVYTSVNGEHIIADVSGNIISKGLDFDHIYEFRGNVAKAIKDNKIYLIDSKGEILVDTVDISNAKD